MRKNFILLIDIRSREYLIAHLTLTVEESSFSIPKKLVLFIKNEPRQRVIT